MNKEYIKIFENCKLVKGNVKCTLNDLQRKVSYHISMDLYLFCNELNGLEYSLFLEKYSHDEKYMRYFSFLMDNEVIFITEFPELFPELDLLFDTPFVISNSIIDIFENYEFALSFVHKLKSENLSINAVQIRIYKSICIGEFKELINSLATLVYNVQIILPFSINFDYEKVINSHNNIEKIIVFGAPNNKEVFTKDTISGRLQYTTEIITSEKCCGNSISNYFTTNLKFFTESISHNSCLNKKLSIDKDGFIKNCPSMSDNFGHINDATLHDVLSQIDFKKYWNIGKDKIKECKICEFRYICLDCRAYTKNDEIYGKPIKCKYNPYEGEFI